MAYQVFETSIFNRVIGAEAHMLFVPRDVAAEFESAARVPMALGVRLGVRIPDAEGLVDVLYASAQGRVHTFDEGSFQRWRPRWQNDQDERSRFAQEIVFGDRVPVQESPLQLDSLAHLLGRGEGYVADGAEWAYSHPVHALGVVVFVQGSILIASLGRAVRETIVIAAKYHLRRALGVPEDWTPPEDR
jgi:hypothetical protein